jgi:hypothetical protein
LDEFLGVEVDIIEEPGRQLVESRGIDLGHKFLQVFVYSFEIETRESGENKASWRRWTLAFLVGKGLRGFEIKVKFFEAGQHGEASDHRLG